MKGSGSGLNLGGPRREHESCFWFEVSTPMFRMGRTETGTVVVVRDCAEPRGRQRRETGGGRTEPENVYGKSGGLYEEEIT